MKQPMISFRAPVDEVQRFKAFLVAERIRNPKASASAVIRRALSEYMNRRTKKKP